MERTSRAPDPDQAGDPAAEDAEQQAERQLADHPPACPQPLSWQDGGVRHTARVGTVTPGSNDPVTKLHAAHLRDHGV
jgi:hypothetical protein